MAQTLQKRATKATLCHYTHICGFQIGFKQLLTNRGSYFGNWRLLGKRILAEGSSLLTGCNGMRGWFIPKRMKQTPVVNEEQLLAFCSWLSSPA